MVEAIGPSTFLGGNQMEAEAPKAKSSPKANSREKRKAFAFRLVTLGQLLLTACCVLFAIHQFGNTKMWFNVPEELLAGDYPMADIPDYVYSNLAQDFVSAVATYQPYIATRQFEHASSLLYGPVKDRFLRSKMGNELKAIQDTSRSQSMFIDHDRTQVASLDADTVQVGIIGAREKIIDGQVLPVATLKFLITIEKAYGETENQYGLVVTNYEEEVVK